MVVEQMAVSVADPAAFSAPAIELAPSIVWLGGPAAGDRALVGGKVAPLSRLAAQFRVPPGFCLTTHAYDLAGACASRTDAANGSSQTDMTDGVVLPDLLRREVAAAYRQLAELTGIEQP